MTSARHKTFGTRFACRASLSTDGRGLCVAVANMNDTGRPRYLDSDTSRYHRKRPEFKKQKQFARRKCSWALCLPVSALLLVAAYLYFKGRPADVSHWGHTSTPDKNLTYWYKVGRACSCTPCHWSACLHTSLTCCAHDETCQAFAPTSRTSFRPTTMQMLKVSMKSIAQHT